MLPHLEKIAGGLVSVLKWIGAASLASMMLLTCADVVLRAAGRPIWGAVEIAGFLATTALACSLPFTHAVRGHVGVDLLVRRLSARTQSLVDLGTSLAGLALFIVVAWRMFAYGQTLRKAGEVSMTLEFPAYYFRLFQPEWPSGFSAWPSWWTSCAT